MDDRNTRQRNLFDDDAKARQKQELEAAYVKERQRLESKSSEHDARLQQAESQLDSDRKLHESDRESVSEGSLRSQEKDIEKLRKEQSESAQKLQTLSENEDQGMQCIDAAQVTRGPEGEVRITAPVGPPQPRLKYEGKNRSGLESRTGEERLHSRGAGLGFECDCGINYGSPEVNQEFQRLGIEGDIQQFQRQKRDDCQLILTTETRAKEGTSDLESIHYDLKVQTPDGRTRDVYSVTVLQDKNGVHLTDERRGSAYEDQSWMKSPSEIRGEGPTPDRKESAARNSGCFGEDQNAHHKTQTQGFGQDLQQYHESSLSQQDSSTMKQNS